MDIDMEPSASQSQDCEPTPPLQRHGSKSNFFLPPTSMGGPPGGAMGAQLAGHMGNQMMGQNGDDSPGRHPVMRSIHYSARGSPHPRPRVVESGRGGTPDNLGKPLN